MDSYQELNIKWFIFFSISVAENKTTRFQDAKNETIWKGQGHFSLSMVKNDRNGRKSGQPGKFHIFLFRENDTFFQLF